MSDLHPVIDVSRWQGWIDWPALRDVHGIHGAWIKCGGADGGHYTDSQWANNRANATGVMPWGTYFFASPALGNAQGQAQYAVSIGHGEGDLWPALDLEYNLYGMTGGQLDDWAVQFCDEVRRLTGRESVLYSGGYFGVGTNAGHPIGRLDFWVANYGTNAPGTTPPAFDPYVPPAWADTGYGSWQFNSTTRYVPGVEGNTVDTNTLRSWLWDRMMGGAPPDEEDDMPPFKTLARTAVGSAWALEQFGNNSVSHYLLVVESTCAVRLLTGESLNLELLFQDKTIDQVPEWQDNMFTGRRYFVEWDPAEVEADPGTTNIQVTVFAVVLVALLWLVLELGRWAQWYEVSHGQIAALIGVTVGVAALVAAFVRWKGDGIVSKLRRPHRAEG